MSQNSKDSFEDKIVHGLDNYSNQLVVDTLIRLRHARNKALADSSHANYTWGVWPGVAGFVAIVLLLTVSLHWQSSSPVVTPLLDDLDLLMTEDLEFYQQLEFLQWMDANGVEIDS